MTKFAGVINGLIVLTALISIFIGFNEVNGFDQFVILLFLLPTYFLSYFLIRYKFGFIGDQVLEEKYAKLLYYGSVLINTLIIVTAIILGIKYICIEFNKYEMNKETSQLELIYSKTKKWNSNTTAYGFEGQLVTKYSEGKLNYQLSVDANTSNGYRLNKISGYIIRLLDKEGFMIHEIDVTDFLSSVDSLGNETGISANSSYILDVHKYAKMADWDFGIKEK